MTGSDPVPARFELHGRTLGYPTRFRDGSSSMGLFAVPSEAASRIIAGTGFTVAEVAPGRAMLSLNCVHYTDTDCGAYEEIALAFFVERPDRVDRLPYLPTWWRTFRGQVASHTWRLAVTTELARDAGIEMWGFPKTLEEITYDRGERATFTWRADGHTVLSYSTTARGRREPAPISPPVYSLLGGVPHVSHLTQRYRGVGHRPGGGTLQLGDHPVADTLRTLGLPRRPLVAVWNEHLSFDMSAPERVPRTSRGGERV